ncbi:MAG: GvpL/GvpF family gas vesicle protein [Myxococcales bacterium]|nr:GvpL/GvpF family gas vesicle protein [Myxococcales bacterium]
MATAHASRKPPRHKAAPHRPPARGGKYVYCIAPQGEPLEMGRIGIGQTPSGVFTVPYQQLVAVVSDVPRALEPTRENVLAHQRVTEAVMARRTVLPLAFGSVFRSRKEVLDLLRSAHDAFGEVLAKMKDKLELGLKVLWDREEIIREIESEDPAIRRLRSEISHQKGSTYFARTQYGRLLEATLHARSERYARDIFGALRPVSVAARSRKLLGEKMIINAAFLVSREREKAFDRQVRELGERLRELTFRYTGPWPPYSFANIRLNLERVRPAHT